MRKLVFASIVILAMLLSSCATTVGGRKYYAKVVVNKHPDALILHKDTLAGIGTAVLKLKRARADEVVFCVSKEGCKTQEFSFDKRRYRFGASVGSLVFWSSISYSPFIIIPLGLGVDHLTGAVWKPDDKNKQIEKVDFDLYTYKLNYTGCDSLESDK